MFRTFLALLAIMFGVISNAHACSCVGATPESGQKLIDKAFYIGTVKVSHIENVKDLHSQKVTLEADKSYTKNFEGAILVDNNPGQAMCGYGVMEEGQVYEVIIFQREDSSYVTAGYCDSLMPEQWEELRTKTGETNEHK